MTSILVVSTERYSGKSSLIAGLGLELKDRGFTVGYMKPVGSYPMKVDEQKVDEDAYFTAQALELDDPLPQLSPFFLTWDTLNRYMRRKTRNAPAEVKKIFAGLSEGKDLMLLEGAQNFIHGSILGLSAIEVSKLLDSWVLLLDTYNDELTVDRILAGREYFADRFLGVILNWVPERRMSFTTNLLPRFMESKDVKVFGAMPTDRVLRSITVKDLAAGLNGEIICAWDKSDELVESMMVGAMGQEQALRLFRKHANKVVITGGDRSDIQLAALETPTKSLVLTGGHRPTPVVLGHAEEMGVPIILVGYDTATTVEMVDAAIGQQKVHSPKKVARMRQYIREALNLDLILECAGLPAEKDA